ncbi:hypothetical protein Vadar_000558 [Vaccinium darrowii]|uniref:Uncharacterized protein n=1 Tax=Vaccinium darrowii TaxID=229202 RepID=A0ACB7YSW7_9ERIC|nr:hypothetical protein Vadar_000558 [Vaccinium darrowii]
MDSEDSDLFTIFVDNLPEDVGLIWFRKFFNQYGVVVDAYIPIKRTKVTKRRFGFVRYNCASSAEVAISKANGFWIEDRKLFVKWAAFDVHRNKPIQNKVDQVLSNGNGTMTHERKNLVGFGLSFADVVVGRNRSKPIRPSVRVSVDRNKWLDRSAVGWLASPRSMDSLRQGFIDDGFPNIQVIEEQGVVINSLEASNRHALNIHPVDIGDAKDDVSDEVVFNKENVVEGTNSDCCNKSMEGGDESRINVDVDPFMEQDLFGRKTDDFISNSDSLMGDSNEEIESFEDTAAARHLKNEDLDWRKESNFKQHIKILVAAIMGTTIKRSKPPIYDENPEEEARTEELKCLTTPNTHQIVPSSPDLSSKKRKVDD